MATRVLQGKVMTIKNTRLASVAHRIKLLLHFFTLLVAIIIFSRLRLSCSRHIDSALLFSCLLICSPTVDSRNDFLVLATSFMLPLILFDYQLFDGVFYL
jgi:hypothetical protein